MSKKIKIHDPFIDKNEKIAVQRVLDSHLWALSRGNGIVSEFETRFKNYVKCAGHSPIARYMHGNEV